jgi:hypothetical protein
MSIVGADEMTIEATKSLAYIDQGASCTDEVDGDLSSTVTVEGVTPELGTPGRYEIKYACANSVGLPAPVLTRVVLVVDTTCPVCTVRGADSQTVEASFPYTDEGAACTDTLDGDLSAKIKAVNVVDVEEVGTYVIEYRVADASGNWNDGTTTRAVGGSAPCTVAHHYYRTVQVVDTLKPVVSVYKGGTGELMQVGAQGPRSTAQGNPANPVAANYIHTQCASDRRRLMGVGVDQQQGVGTAVAVPLAGMLVVLAVAAGVRASIQRPTAGAVPEL